MLSTEALLEDLTDAQREAVTHVDGPLLIIAGAGSGKTRVLTRRVAYLISLGIPATSICAITFTNKAAGEMRERVGKLLGRPIKDIGRLDQWHPTVCTFHSLCVRILRSHGTRLGIPANFTIYDSSDQQKVVKEALKALDISSTNFAPGMVHSTISNLKNQLITPDDAARSAGAFFEKNIARIYGKYQSMLQANNALDFDDLLMRVVHGFREHPDVLAELQDRYQYLMIDEYQDTNHAQYVLAHALALKHRNMCVVGDPDQSIYAWRGANIQNILDFEKDYTDAKVVKLEQNYRSSKTILAAAAALISKNTRRKEKGLWTENPDGEKIDFFICQDEVDEANVIIEQFRRFNAEGQPWSQMAIFYRMNALSRVMEERLFKAGIPYQIARGTEFYNRKEIKDVMAYLRVLANPADEVSLERVINTPTRGIGDETVRKISVYAVGSGLSLWEGLQQASLVPGLSTRALNGIAKFVEMMTGLRNELQQPHAKVMDIFDSAKGTVQSIMESVVEKSGLRASLEKSTDPDKPELANVKELINSGAQFDVDQPEGTLDDYLAQVSLMSDADKLGDGEGVVTLMTLHAAKGLEFPVVAMIGLEEGVLPHSRARTSPDDLEEERRLAFVGITRAQEKLIMSRAYARTMMGRRERTVPSPFIREMPEELFEVTDRTGGSFRPDYGSTVESGEYQRGQMVRHPIFGIGRIAEVSDAGHGTRVTVDFVRYGQKKLIVEHANLQVLA